MTFKLKYFDSYTSLTVIAFTGSKPNTEKLMTVEVIYGLQRFYNAPEANLDGSFGADYDPKDSIGKVTPKTDF